MPVIKAKIIFDSAPSALADCCAATALARARAL